MAAQHAPRTDAPVTARLLAAGALSACLVGCSGSDPAPTTDGGPDVDMNRPSAALVEQVVAYEGQEHFVTSVYSPGLDLTDATIEAENADGALEVRNVLCNSQRCGVEIRIRDVYENSGIPVPAAFESHNNFLRIRARDGQERQALVSVWPVDSLAATSALSVGVHDSLIAAYASAASGTLVHAAPIGGPVRWYVNGAVTFAGMFDVSVTDASPLVGGFAGGMPGTAGEGDGGGAGATNGHGGGGGGAAEVGGNGTQASGMGEGAAGGHTSGTAIASCQLDGTLTECGGSGGGGSVGAGGAGGGTLVFISLERIDLSGATLDASGGDGVNGGGGGAGGNVVIIAPEWTPPESIDVEGGNGGTTSDGATGGHGSRGFVRIDVPGVHYEGAFNGPAIRHDGIAYVTRAESIHLSGTAEPNTPIRFSPYTPVTALTNVTADSNGAFEADVPLVPGLNRIRVTAQVGNQPIRAFTGNAYEFDDQQPIGAFIDIACIPEAE